MSDAVLTIRDLTALGILLDGVQRGAGIKWTPDGGDTIREGVLRRFCWVDGTFMNDAEDVRDAAVEVTGGTVSYRLPVADLMAWITAGEAAVR